MSPYIEIILRTIAVYFFIVVAIRLFGKKELSQLTVTDLVFILLISNSVQNAMVGDNTGLLGGLVAATSLFLVNTFLKYLLYRNHAFRKFVEGEPIMLVHSGKVIQKNMKSQRITLDELEEAIREHGVSSVDKVNLAILEPDGNISILSDNYQRKSVRKRKSHKILSKVS